MRCSAPFPWLNLLGEPNLQRRAAIALFTVLHKYPQQLATLTCSNQAALTVALACATALGLAIAHRRFGSAPHWTSTVRQAILGFLAVMGLSCAIDAFLVSRDAMHSRSVPSASILNDTRTGLSSQKPGASGSASHSS